MYRVQGRTGEPDRGSTRVPPLQFFWRGGQGVRSIALSLSAPQLLREKGPGDEGCLRRRDGQNNPKPDTVEPITRIEVEAGLRARGGRIVVPRTAAQHPL